MVRCDMYSSVGFNTFNGQCFLTMSEMVSAISYELIRISYLESYLVIYGRAFPFARGLLLFNSLESKSQSET